MSRVVGSLPSPTPVARTVAYEDFYAYLPLHQYLFVPTGELWSATSVDNKLPKRCLRDADGDDTGKPVKASLWLDTHRSIEQMTWAPGSPRVIRDRLVADGGWIPREGCTTGNLYRPPPVVPGDPALAGPWVEHVTYIYGPHAPHIFAWLAHRLQCPHEKINHALVLGGGSGIGKDSLLEPVKAAIGAWNFAEVSPSHLMGRFNGFVKSVILRISEAHDLGDVNRYAFYDRMKIYTASPPDVIRVDEKHLREHAVFNVCGVIITTNHKTDGLYLAPDDRRHYIAWSDLTLADFDADYFPALWSWFKADGLAHVAAWLRAYDLTEFNPKAAPPKTDAWYDMVDASRAPEDGELADALDALQNPTVVTLTDLLDSSLVALEVKDWIRDRKNRRAVPHRLQSCGYVPTRNPAAKDGLWVLSRKRQVFYALSSLSKQARLDAVTARVVDQ